MPNEAFLGNWGQQLVPEPKFCTFVLIFTLSAARIYQSDGLFNSTASISRLAYPIASPHGTVTQFRNINRISIDYGSRPRLRYRLTLRRLT
jgi:hypothetical protein